MITSAHAAASVGVVDDKAVFLRLGAGGAACRQTNANIGAAIAQIQRVRVSP